LEPEALTLMRSKGIKHLMLDLPSVDREVDGGRLQAHHAFWKSGFKDDDSCTITEMIFVPDQVADGAYLLNLQTAPFENDATPSRPVLFKLNS
jgi:kynurenine formamidase